jgi:hypothetical protein
MSNRCPDCNKFVGLQAGDPEAQEPELNGCEVSVEVRVVLNCTECDGEMKEWNIELMGDIPNALQDHIVAHEEAKEKYEITVTADDPTVDDSYRPSKLPEIDKKTGKPRHVPFRFQTHYYQVSCTINFECSCGKKDFGTLDLTEENAASGFDDLN